MTGSLQLDERHPLNNGQFNRQRRHDLQGVGAKWQTLWAFALALVCAQGSVAGDQAAPEDRKEKTGFVYGAGLIVSAEPYRGFDTRVIPLPVLGYQGERLRILGPFVSYDLIQADNSRLSLRAAPRFQGYDDSDSDFFEGMQDRDSSVDAGLGFNYDRDDWKFEAAAMVDALGKSDGYELSTKVGRVFRKGPIFLEPSLALSYLDDNNVDYYYGVREGEQTDFRAAYKGDATINATIGFSVSTPILFGGFTRLAMQHTWNGSNINDSPLVNSDSQWSVQLMFSKFF